VGIEIFGGQLSSEKGRGAHIRRFDFEIEFDAIRGLQQAPHSSCLCIDDDDAHF
jgi:hypothetical protein